MILYIVRHAEAEERQEGRTDEWRHLTAKGRRTAIKIGRAISGLGPKPRQIITSPLTRTVQTAELIAQSACRKMSMATGEMLIPGADVAVIVEFLAAGSALTRVMLVGHEPQLGTLVQTLLQSDRRIELKNGACVALKMGKKGKPAEFLWYLAPGGKPATSARKAFRNK